MGGRPGGATLKSRIRRWFVGLEFRQMRQLAVVSVLAATALFGGLDTVDHAVTTFQPGEEFSDGEFTVVVERASLVNELRADSRLLRAPMPGTQYLGVVATVRNDANRSNGLRNEIDLRDQPKAEFVGVMRLSRGTPILTLGPGLQEEVAFVWSLPESAARPGQDVQLRIWKKRLRELAVSYGQAWIDSETEYGQVTVRLRGLR